MKGVARNHTPAQVRAALTMLIANEGNVSETIRVIARDGLANGTGSDPVTVTIKMLRLWRDSLYSEVYDELERAHATEIERAIISQTRARAYLAGEIEVEMMERMRTSTQDRDLPHALRSITDVKSKNLDALMKLTGREQREGEALGLESLIHAMAKGGYLKIAVDMDGPAAIEGTAVDEK